MQEYLIASEKNATLETLSQMPWCSITLISRQMMHNGRMQVLQSRALEVLLRLLKKEVMLFLRGYSLSFSLVIFFLLSASILIANQVSGGRAKYMSRDTKYTCLARLVYFAWCLIFRRNKTTHGQCLIQWWAKSQKILPFTLLHRCHFRWCCQQLSLQEHGRCCWAERQRSSPTFRGICLQIWHWGILASFR